jgi:HK97 family phage major capsid protein
MTREQYLAKRAELIAQAEQAVNDSKLEDFKTIEASIKKVDEEFEAFALAHANLNAMKDHAVDAGFMNQAGIPANRSTGKVSVGENVRDEKSDYVNVWAKVMMNQSLSSDEKSVFDKINVQNATQTAKTHQILIPETVAQGIWKEAGELFPIVGDLGTALTFVRGNLTIIRETNGGADAAWYDEDTEVIDGTLAFNELNLTGCELAKSVPISWQLLKMGPEQFIAYIQTLLAEKMGAALAKAIVSGKGKPGVGQTFKPEPRGILTVLEAESGKPQIVTYSTAAGDGLSYDKISSAFGKIKAQYLTELNIYATSKTIFDQLNKIKDNEGRPMFISDVSAGIVGRIFGRPVKVDDSIEDGSILFANLPRGYAANVNEDMTIYTEENVKKRRNDYMGYSIVDGDVATTKAFAYIEKAV